MVLSVHASVICPGPVVVADRPLGASGTFRLTGYSFDGADDPTAFTANTR